MAEKNKIPITDS